MGLSAVVWVLNPDVVHLYRCIPREPIIMSPHVGYRFPVFSEIERGKGNNFSLHHQTFPQKSKPPPRFCAKVKHYQHV